MQPEEHGDKLVPFIGVITPKGVAYTATSAATGLGAMTLNQAVQDNWRARDGKLTREEAYELLRKSMELSLYHDCMADNEYDLASVDATGVTLEKPETLTGNWQIGETNCQVKEDLEYLRLPTIFSTSDSAVCMCLFRFTLRFPCCRDDKLNRFPTVLFMLLLGP